MKRPMIATLEAAPPEKGGVLIDVVGMNDKQYAFMREMMEISSPNDIRCIERAKCGAHMERGEPHLGYMQIHVRDPQRKQNFMLMLHHGLGLDDHPDWIKS